MFACLLACPAHLGAVVKVGVAVLGSPSLISLMVSVDVKQHTETKKALRIRAQESCAKKEVDLP